MSSALSYYATKNRANARLENKRDEISRSSAYMIDTGSSSNRPSYTPSYGTLKRESSFTADSSRVGRSRIRDHSVDYSARPSRRSSSLEISAPVKLRARDVSIDIGSSRRDYTNGLSSTNSYTPSSRTSRPKTTNFEDDHSEEYKKIMSTTDKYLTMSKYAKTDKDTTEVNGMMEEDRRSNAYRKIINQQSVASLETDCARSTLTDIFMNTGGFSAKTVEAINKEMLYKEDKGPKNYSWRKDMESYEDNLEKTNQHKRNVREATKATRDVCYKDTNYKIRDYDRECRRSVDSEPVRTAGIIISTRPVTQTTSYNNTAAGNNKDYSSHRTNNTAVTTVLDSTAEIATEKKRGSWRTDMEKYEDKINKKNNVSDTKLETSRNVTTSSVDSQPKTYSWQKPNNTSAEKQATERMKTENSTPTTPLWKKPETVKQVEIKTKEPEKQVPAWKKSQNVKEEEPKSLAPETLVPSSKKPETVKEEVKPAEPEKPVVTEKPVPKWKKPDSIKKEDAKAVEPEKPVPIKKTPETVKKEEPKPAEAEKPVPKWKKTEAAKKEETKPTETPKSVPQWKTAKKEEPKPAEVPKPAETKPKEPEKPVPKWKKQAVVKKEEPKPAEPEKPVPKWKKPETAKKEEAKPTETPKPVPKWKKPETDKKEEPKPAETEKPVPKWKKPVSVKNEEPKPAEPEKTVPKWKKPAEPELKLEVEPTQIISVPKPVNEPEPESQSKSESSNPEASNTAKPASEATETKQEEKKEEEEEEDVTGMRAMRKEQDTKFADMEAEFAAGASKLSALRAKMKALRLKSKASAEADAAADAARKR
eukprot:GFUD01011292.1.p1 GENE.GFUD01011292.1~~GFUD01011292.1.p1  ORF type:complete len:816 (+),score=283.88 GFUD01011292.1:87-2534(+)